MTDWLQETGDAAAGGTAIKQAELTNLTFTIKSVQYHEFTDQKGNPGASYIGTIRIDGQEEDVEAWLGGIRVMAQMKEILRRNALPFRVKQVTIEKAYNLEMAGNVPVNGNGKAALAAYMKANQLKASEVLATIGAPVGEDVKQSWSDYLEKVTSLNGITEDAACAEILDLLQKQPEDIPFE